MALCCLLLVGALGNVDRFFGSFRARGLGFGILRVKGLGVEPGLREGIGGS